MSVQLVNCTDKSGQICLWKSYPQGKARNHNSCYELSTG